MNRQEVHIETNSSEETFHCGCRLADVLESGDVVALYGDLGSGKTVFVKGICAGLDVTGDVTSPTFTLIQEYSGRVPVFHFDFYRMESVAEIEDLDLDRYFDAQGVSLIEWAERGESLLPEKRISVTIQRVAEGDESSYQRRSLQIATSSLRHLSGLTS